MTRDELEYSISQYLDGTLLPPQRDALEERLASDAEARTLLSEYRALDAALKSDLPLPAVQWDRLQASISAAVAQEEPPVRHYSMKWVRSAAGLAVAASVLVAAALAVVLNRPDRTEPVGGTDAVASIHVQGPQPEVGPQPVIEVTIGPAPQLQDDPLGWRYAEGVVIRPSRVVIASSLEGTQNSAQERY